VSKQTHKGKVIAAAAIVFVRDADGNTRVLPAPIRNAKAK
jgi:hypothetical protein